MIDRRDVLTADDLAELVQSIEPPRFDLHVSKHLPKEMTFKDGSHGPGAFVVRDGPDMDLRTGKPLPVILVHPDVMRSITD